MTTTITLKTHSWPVEVEIVDNYSPTPESHTRTTTRQVVEPQTTTDFHITSTRHITFLELPIPTE